MRMEKEKYNKNKNPELLHACFECNRHQSQPESIQEPEQVFFLKLLLFIYEESKKREPEVLR